MQFNNFSMKLMKTFWSIRKSLEGKKIVLWNRHRDTVNVTDFHKILLHCFYKMSIKYAVFCLRWRRTIMKLFGSWKKQRAVLSRSIDLYQTAFGWNGHNILFIYEYYSLNINLLSAAVVTVTFIYLLIKAISRLPTNTSLYRILNVFIKKGIYEKNTKYL